jgi:hypothetical protein
VAPPKRRGQNRPTTTGAQPMASAKDDTSTDIESLVKQFAKDMTAVCEVLKKVRATRIKAAADKAAAKKDAKAEPKEEELPEITFALDPGAATKVRTPAEQAKQVADGKSWVCWGAHMADKARHVIMKADGKLVWEPKKIMGAEYEAFKKSWGTVMKTRGLKNAKGADGWYDGDAFHLEMPDSKIAKTDERVEACLCEYVKLTRDAGKTNDKFEKDYAKLLKPHIEKYEKANKKK